MRLARGYCLPGVVLVSARSGRACHWVILYLLQTGHCKQIPQDYFYAAIYKVCTSTLKSNKVVIIVTCILKPTQGRKFMAASIHHLELSTLKLKQLCGFGKAMAGWVQSGRVHLRHGYRVSTVLGEAVWNSPQCQPKD